MLAISGEVFTALADPTRRALFERLSREGEMTVRLLTDNSGVSQPAVSKHLGILKHAGLVRARHTGRQTHYSARARGLGPLVDWMTSTAVSGTTGLSASKTYSQGWTNDYYPIPCDRKELPHPRKKSGALSQKAR